MRERAGFTLIELILVLMVLGILAAVVVPRFMQLQEQARVQAAQSAVAEGIARFRLAYEQHQLQNDGAAVPQNAEGFRDVMGFTSGDSVAIGDYILQYHLNGGGDPNSIEIRVFPAGDTAALGDVLTTGIVTWPE